MARRLRRVAWRSITPRRVNSTDMSGWQSGDQSSDPDPWAEADLKYVLVTLQLQQVDDRPVDVGVENGH